MLAQTKLTVKQYYGVRTIRTGKCAYAVESKGNAIGEVNRAIVNWWRGSGFWGINKRARLERGQLQILKQADAGLHRGNQSSATKNEGERWPVYYGL